MLSHPLVLLAASWKAWLHPRGKDGRFMETFAFVDVYSNPRDPVGRRGRGGRKSPRMRARITKLTDTHAELRYFDSHGKVIPADPANGYPEQVPSGQIHSKLSLAPKAIARIDGKRDRNMWIAISAQFNADLRENPPKGKSHNERGTELTPDSSEWKEHQEYVNDVLDRASTAGITSGEYLKDKEGNWGPETTTYFENIVKEEIAKVKERGVPQGNHAVMLGGLPGSGKSSTVENAESAFAQAGFADKSKWITVNPDLFKELLIERGDIPQIDGLSPMETAPLFHSLSSELSHMFGRELMSQGYNIILDLTMRGDPDETTELTPPETEAEVMRGLGYRIDGVFADLPASTAFDRQKSRQLAGLNELRKGESSLGGRVVPPGLTRRDEAKSRNIINFEKMASDGRFTTWAVVDTTTRDAPVRAAGAGVEIFPDPVEALKDPTNIPGVVA